MGGSVSSLGCGSDDSGCGGLICAQTWSEYTLFLLLCFLSSFIFSLLILCVFLCVYNVNSEFHVNAQCVLHHAASDRWVRTRAAGPLYEKASQRARGPARTAAVGGSGRYGSVRVTAEEIKGLKRVQLLQRPNAACALLFSSEAADHSIRCRSFSDRVWISLWSICACQGGHERMDDFRRCFSTIKAQSW